MQSKKGMSILKRILTIVLALMVLGCFLPAMASAQELAVLNETELSAWIDQTLRDTVSLTPLNSPVNEDALTEDGYAFLYDFATLYYNQQELSATSILQAVSLTDEGYACVRGIGIGSTQEQLMEAFGSLNPYLLGDGTFAVLYQQDQMPEAAYWGWAQHDETHTLTGMQCAMHVKAGEDRYTDAGVRFVLENGIVTEIRVYGLHKYITAAEVAANLEAVRTVENAMGAWALAEENAEGYTVESTAAAFSEADLAFSGVDFRTLTVEQLNVLLGGSARIETITAENDRMTNAEWQGAYLSAGSSGNADVLSVADSRLEGPRGIHAGDSLDKVLSSFAADGEGRRYGSQSILYGDGQTAPFGVLESDGTYTTVSYTAQMQRGAEWLNVTLMLTFSDDLLTEWMIYTW